MNTDVKIFISSCLIVLNAYHFIRLCISYFKDKKKDIDRFERLRNCIQFKDYVERFLIINIVLYLLCKFY
jgi:hypothetical protein|nr:MAG TPA: hypothetical protein [Caudoviricetes sp.]